MIIWRKICSRSEMERYACTCRCQAYVLLCKKSSSSWGKATKFQWTKQASSNGPNFRTAFL